MEDKEDAKSLKQKTRERVRPKMGKLTIDYQKLHDAFFKWQTKPKMSIHGDLYYEVGLFLSLSLSKIHSSPVVAQGKEFETRLRMKKPGDLSDELRRALGMPTGLVRKVKVHVCCDCLVSVLLTGKAQVPPAVVGCYATIWSPSLIPQP